MTLMQRRCRCSSAEQLFGSFHDEDHAASLCRVCSDLHGHGLTTTTTSRHDLTMELEERCKSKKLAVQKISMSSWSASSPAIVSGVCSGARGPAAAAVGDQDYKLNSDERRTMSLPTWKAMAGASPLVAPTKRPRAGAGGTTTPSSCSSQPACAKKKQQEPCGQRHRPRHRTSSRSRSRPRSFVPVLCHLSSTSSSSVYRVPSAISFGIASAAAFSYDAQAPLQDDERYCLAQLDGFTDLRTDEYRNCRKHLITAFWRNEFGGSYDYSNNPVEDCAFWGQVAVPDTTFHKLLSFERLAAFRLEEQFLRETVGSSSSRSEQGEHGADEEAQLQNMLPQPPLFGLPDTKKAMIYIGAFKNGTDGAHFAAHYPDDLEVHFFEPSPFYFQQLMKNVLGHLLEFQLKHRVIPENKPLHLWKNVFFHNFGVGLDTEIVRLSFSGDSSTMTGAGPPIEDVDGASDQRTGSGGDSASRRYVAPSSSENILVRSVSEMFQIIDRARARDALTDVGNHEFAWRPTSTGEQEVDPDVVGGGGGGTPERMVRQYLDAKLPDDAPRAASGEQDGSQSDEEDTSTVETEDSLSNQKLYKSVALLHMNCEGCEYDILPALNFATLASLPYMQFATHVLQSNSVSQTERVSKSLSGYCRSHENLSRTHRRVIGVPFVWERWERKCNWQLFDLSAVRATTPTPSMPNNYASYDKIVGARELTEAFDWNLRDQVEGEDEEKRKRRAKDRGLLSMSYIYETFAATCGMTICNIVEQELKTSAEQENEGREPSERVARQLLTGQVRDLVEGTKRKFGFAYREALFEGDTRRCFLVVYDAVGESDPAAVRALDYTHVFQYGTR